jgi:hypothetical protein
MSKFSKTNPQPPELQVVPKHTHVFRFLSDGANVAVTVGSLLGVGGCIGTVTNTHMVSIASAVQLHKVSVWSEPAALGAEASATVEYATGIANAPDEEKITSVVGTAIPRCLHSTPPPKSLASFVWNSTSAATVLFNIASPAGSVVDVEATFWFSNQIAASTQNVVTAVIGSVYYGYLDGPAAHHYSPLGLASTF